MQTPTKLSVKALRVNCGLLSKDVAKHLGLSLATYSRKENNHGRFYADEAAKLSELFKVPYENFFDAGCLIKTQDEA
ncbi:helix-turn-helix transcriptional regulator [Paenibacillus algorifonticola]|uniref:helix-turn-helix transcriptional regulator n=1 Tax=Paenibacillus algorifonticola TaxID=684063 RepID=UPI000619B2DC|nr:helix-turn-helix transcriptional regulator [Paenibacillus algorifonticola]